MKVGSRFRKDLGDINSLAYSVKKVGLLHPIVVNESSHLIAGRRRIEAFKKLGRTEIPAHIVNLGEVHTGELHENTVRKDFTISEAVEIKKAIEPKEREEAQKRQSGGQELGGKLHNSLRSYGKLLGANCSPSNSDNINDNGGICNKGRTREKVAKYLGISHTTLNKAEKVYDAAKSYPEMYGDLLDKLDEKKISSYKAFKQLQRRQQKENLLKTKPVMYLPEGVKLFSEDFRKSSRHIRNNSVDLVFSDPPYNEESLPLYKDLAELGKRVLKPGGSLVAYAVTYAIPQILDMILSAGLTYWWMMSVILQGSFARNYPRQVSIKWKPLVWFVKGDKINTPDFTSDTIHSTTPSKRVHEWEQSIIEPEHIISGLTVENQTVLDPMMGYGTSGVAALRLKRKFVGIEIDPETFEIAKRRIGKVIDGSFNRIDQL